MLITMNMFAFMFQKNYLLAKEESNMKLARNDW